VLTQKHVVHGFGGIGKTEAAKQYAHRYRQSYKEGVFWVNAESVGSINDSYRKIVVERLRMKSVEEEKDAAVVRDSDALAECPRRVAASARQCGRVRAVAARESYAANGCEGPSHVLLTSRANPDVFTD
jgi:hypothetical protein